MRIISKFHDYYDSCRGYGFDPNIIYNRVIKEIKITCNPKHEVKDVEMERHIQTIKDTIEDMPIFRWRSNGVVLFCGKVYPFLYDSEDAKYHYSFGSLYQEVKKRVTQAKYKSQNDLDFLAGKKQKYGQALTKESWKKFDEDRAKEIDSEVHRYFAAPVIKYHKGSEKITLNPVLRELDFASQIDPFTAFQTLAMYVGNDLVEQKDPNPPISDELRAQSKGFDKWTFRKQK